MLELRRTISRPEVISAFHDVQANILTSHGSRFALHALVRFRPETVAATAEWIGSFARARVRSASEQIADPSAGRSDGGLANVFLSAGGYRRLGLEPPRERSFLGGMKAANLNDPAVAEWEEPYRQDLDALVSLAYSDSAALPAAERELAALAAVADVVAVEHGNELDGGREHFGFVEGISQPLFLDEEIAAARASSGPKALWDPATNLDRVLVADPHGRGPHSLGSFFVFRKLEQDVAAFQRNLRTLAAALGIDEELAGAFIVGRFRDGTPVSLQDGPGAGAVNGFSYADDKYGRRCPFHSHIRRVNPRGDLDYITETPDRENRIARRGLPYGRPGEPHVGLLFTCFQSNINTQFELIQINWANFPDFPRVGIGPDPLIGQRNTWDHTPGHPWPAGWDGAEKVRVGLEPCVTMKGGEYFFAPSLSCLENLGGTVRETRA
ncbi:MAG TPA: Dyp-type peroxidase [Thermoanaerobaculia bacterium]|nr:Dyp-type peroxidase [Thermoanaerobaculia bacterium]